MRKPIFIIVLAIAGIGAALLFAKPKVPSMGNKTVVVELFTSQG